jgi:hypothetical protein
MLGEQASVEHIWIRDENPSGSPDLSSLALNGIAVITVGRDGQSTTSNDG